jgi:hypothetical protein
MGHALFHVLRPGWHTAETGVVAIARPGVALDERVVLLHGYRPRNAPSHRAIAPVVLAGEVDERLVYVERIPDGALLADVVLPADLYAVVVRDVLDGLDTLHEAGLVHGAVAADRVAIGVDGEVVLFGRGRSGGSARIDVADALGLFPDARALAAGSAAAAARLIGEDVLPDDRHRLAEFVAESRVSSTEVSSHPIVLTLRGDVDEVVPDLGEESGGEGLFDAGTGHSESTATRTEGVPTDRSRALWGQVAAPMLHAPPSGRFGAVQGVPSRAILTLVAESTPDVLPGGRWLDRRWGALLEERRVEQSLVVTTFSRGSDTEVTARPVLLHPERTPLWRSARMAAFMALLLSVAALLAMVGTLLGRFSIW